MLITNEPERKINSGKEINKLLNDVLMILEKYELTDEYSYECQQARTEIKALKWSDEE